jgi:hypothetical protein
MMDVTNDEIYNRAKSQRHFFFLYFKLHNNEKCVDLSISIVSSTHFKILKLITICHFL